MDTLDRMPPNDMNAEECVLGSILIDQEAIIRARRVLKPNDFYLVKHQWVYDAMLALKANRQPIDAVTLRRELDARGKLGEIGGPAFITSLMTAVPTALHVEGYANIVANLAVDRRLLSSASTIAQLAYDGEKSRDEKIAASLRTVRNTQPDDAGQVRHVSSIAAELLDDVERWAESPVGADNVRGISTGFTSIDMLTGGMGKQEQTVLIGRTGMGKSALGFEIALNAARAGYRALIVSLEMNRLSLVYRLISHKVGITWQNLQRGWIKSEEWERIYKAVSDIEALPLYIIDRPRRTIAQIESYIAGLEGVDLFVVDHLRLIGDKKEQGESEVSRLGRVSMDLRNVAREYNCHNLLIAQMNRGADNRDDKRPTLADIRQSGEIEENADNVWGIYREDYYNKESLNRGIVEVWPLKNRNGDTSTPATLRYIAEFTHFEKDERPTL